MSKELGKEYPCFGEYKCPRCHKKWQSSKAWADYGQQCKSCSINIMAYHLQKLFVYICTNCKAKWTWAYEAQGQKCKRCSSSTLVRPLDRDRYQDRQFIKAHKLQVLNDVGDENRIDPNKEHREDLCEKCQELGRPCRGTTGQNYISIDNENTFRRSGLITDNQPRRRTLATYNPSLSSSLYNESALYRQNVTDRSSISNTNYNAPFQPSSTYQSYSSPVSKKNEVHKPDSSNDSFLGGWCIIL